jgi:ABC-type dipeptide/oligopeptide/nickel transport system permease component
MALYIVRRLLTLIPILLGVTFLTFVIIQITPGDPVVLMLGNRATPERVAILREELGLDDPLLVQYGRYVTNAVRGDLGYSIRGGTPVMDEILRRAPASGELALTGMLLAIVGGIGIGTVAAVTRSKTLETSLMTGALAGLSIPVFWLAIMLILLFGVRLNWIAVTGGEGWKDLILPSICVALSPGAVLARLTRSSILEVIQEDYVRTAWAKGMTERIVTLRHILRNALIPVVTVAGLLAANLLTGTVFVEIIFGRPGLGAFAINAVFNRDFPQVQGIVLFTATIFVLFNLIVDVLYAYIDPRIRY